nr:hypothetical protein [Tanacetum cinerariifolium]
MVPGEYLEIRDYQLGPVGFEFARENLQSGVKEKDSVTDVKNTLLDFRVMKPLRPSRPCATTQWEDDKLFYKPAYMEYIQLESCKRFGMPKEHHRACLTRTHDSHILPSQEYVLNLDLTLPLGHWFRGDIGLLKVKVVATAKRLEMPLPEVCTAIEEKKKKKLQVKDRCQLH